VHSQSVPPHTAVRAGTPVTVSVYPNERHG